MPIYEYECTRPGCGGAKEVIESFDANLGEDRVTHSCEVCGYAMAREISRSTFRLKGKGWSKDSYQHTVGAP